MATTTKIGNKIWRNTITYVLSERANNMLDRFQSLFQTYYLHMNLLLLWEAGNSNVLQILSQILIYESSFLYKLHYGHLNTQYLGRL